MTGNAFLDLLVIAIPVALVLLWWNGARARELAIAHARRSCRERQLQFLDQSVALSRMRIVRNGTGSACFERQYRFEFTDHADYRDIATVKMLGHALAKVDFPYTRDSEGNRIYIH